ncbi:transcriptional repressor CtsR [Thermincola ferriacetica]|uniref:Transcriptional regulator CtsR n=2 Tax=Thermincola TaxID=278993 RepID=D5X9Q7_THEPJ|nr:MULTISPECIES: CtsR family transcriptional regulator [Thermincola]ADG81128.1 transcriptional repressor, CtsR [Thermincola potens JR]KNZ68473.1 transcriptional repressor CtsR [Thermincola ferriacetica]
MPSLVDFIEEYIKQMLQKSEVVLIRRNELAEKFDCVPSQINYVLSTRFTIDRGYVVESRRGGGGYIKILKLNAKEKDKLLEILYKTVGNEISLAGALGLVERLFDDELITFREASMIDNVIRRVTGHDKSRKGDMFRAEILKSMLMALLKGG